MRLRVPALFVLLAAILAAAPALAQQTRAERPYRGIFGGGVGEAEQELTVEATLGAEAAGNVPGDGQDARLAEEDPRGIIGRTSASVRYGLTRGGFEWRSSWTGNARYRRSSMAPLVGAHTAAVATSIALGRTRVTGSVDASRRPYLSLPAPVGLFAPEAGSATLFALERGAQRRDVLAYDGRLAVSRPLGRRLTLEADYGGGASDFDERASDRDRRTGSARSVLTLTRDLALRLGYVFAETRYVGDDARVIRDQTYDVGLNMNRALSLTRRTTLSFGSGTSGVSDGRRTSYQLVGNARLAHEIGRSWSAVAAYDRGVDFADAFDQPLLSDSVSLGLSGLLTRRLELKVSAGGTRGTIGVLDGGDDQRVLTATGELSLTTAISRHLAVATAYTFYGHRFASAAAVPGGFGREFDNHALRVSLSLWAPLVHRVGRANAAR